MARGGAPGSAPPEPVGRLRFEAEARAGEADRRRREVRRFEHDRLRRAGHLGRGAAHDAGQRLRHRGVRNHQHLRQQLALLAVEGRYLLVLARVADAQLGTGQLRVVERVQRLAGFDHHVVRDVDDVADAADADGGEPAGEPGGRGADGDVREGRDVARAGGTVLDGDAQIARDGGIGRRRERHDGITERRVEPDRDLAREADHAEAVGPVGGDLEIDHRVGRAAVLGGDVFHGRHFEAGHVEGMGQLGDRRLDGHQFAKPGDEDLQSGNCSRKRMSFS